MLVVPLVVVLGITEAIWVAGELGVGPLRTFSLWRQAMPIFDVGLTFVLVLLALPFVIRYERKGLLLGLAFAFMSCGLYFGFDFALRGLGENHLHPVLAAWFTPIFFGALGPKAPKSPAYSPAFERYRRFSPPWKSLPAPMTR